MDMQLEAIPAHFGSELGVKSVIAIVHKALGRVKWKKRRKGWNHLGILGGCRVNLFARILVRMAQVMNGGKSTSRRESSR